MEACTGAVPSVVEPLQDANATVYCTSPELFCNCTSVSPNSAPFKLVTRLVPFLEDGRARRPAHREPSAVSPRLRSATPRFFSYRNIQTPRDLLNNKLVIHGAGDILLAPNPAHAGIYEAGYKRYRTLYTHLAPWFAAPGG